VNYWADHRFFGQLCWGFALLLACYLLVENKGQTAMMKSTYVASSVTRAENVFVHDPCLETQNSFTLDYAVERAFGKTLRETLEADRLILSRPHNHCWKLLKGVWQIYSLNEHSRLEPNIFSSSTPKVFVSEFKTGVSVYYSGSRRNDSYGIEQYVRSLGDHYRSLSKRRTLFGRIGAIFRGIRAASSKNVLPNENGKNGPTADNSDDSSPDVDTVKPELRFSVAALLHLFGAGLLFLGIGDALGIRSGNHILRGVSICVCGGLSIATSVLMVFGWAYGEGWFYL
jgi:hypothetical protein